MDFEKFVSEAGLEGYSFTTEELKNAAEEVSATALSDSTLDQVSGGILRRWMPIVREL